MGELEDKINSLLSSPEEMGRIVKLAKSFVGGDGEPEEKPRPAAQEAGGGIDPDMMKTFTRLMGGLTSKNDKSALVNAMVPYVGAERGKRLSRAVQMAKLFGAARLMFTEHGGGDDGQ